MRSSRAMFVLAASAASIVAGCGSGDDVVVSDPGTSDGVENRSSELTPTNEIDNSALRSGANNSSRAGAVVSGEPDRPTPPTLSAQGAAALAAPTTATTAAPATTAPATTTTLAPETTQAPTTVVTSSTSAPTTDTTQPTDPTGSTTGLADEELNTGEDHSLALLNELRAGLELAALTEDPEMASFARDWSRQMASSGDFEHSTGPYGENIAFTSNTELTPTEAAILFHDLWLDSPGHYGNMTNETYAKMGVGLYLTERGWYATHVFSF